MLIFVKNRENFSLFYPLRKCCSVVSNTSRRKHPDAWESLSGETSDFENSIFKPSAWGCNAVSAIGILTKGRSLKIRHFSDFIV